MIGEDNSRLGGRFQLLQVEPQLANGFAQNGKRSILSNEVFAAFAAELEAMARMELLENALKSSPLDKTGITLTRRQILRKQNQRANR
jgi:hypothetical protein